MCTPLLERDEAQDQRGTTTPTRMDQRAIGLAGELHLLASVDAASGVPR
jgi:hypothetical protein